MSVPVGDSQALHEVGRVQEVSEDEPALDLGALAKRWGPCGSCDFGAPMRCTCDPGDPRVDIARLIAEVERLTVERNNARSKAALLFEENAEALRIAQEALNEEDADAYGQMVRAKALRQVVRILGDETESQ